MALDQIHPKLYSSDVDENAV
ncbi:MAG: hypothetical protein EZS28_012190, partial [Streblomastix strix]